MALAVGKQLLETRWWLLPLPSLHELLVCLGTNLLNPFAPEAGRENSSEVCNHTFCGVATIPWVSRDCRLAMTPG